MSPSCYKRHSIYFLFAIFLASLTGCGTADTTDLEQFIINAKKQNIIKVKALPSPDKYVPYKYISEGKKDPFFADLSIKTPTSNTSSRSKNGVNPNLGRKREVLEKFPLDSLKMVGTLSLNKTNWALIQTADNTLHKTKAGHYIGENLGKITNISNTKVDLIETIPDGLGGWVKRHATLLLAK